MRRVDAVAKYCARHRIDEMRLHFKTDGLAEFELVAVRPVARIADPQARDEGIAGSPVPAASVARQMGKDIVNRPVSSLFPAGIFGWRCRLADRRLLFRLRR